MAHRTAPADRPALLDDPVLVALVQFARARTAVRSALAGLDRNQRRADYDARISFALQRYASSDHRAATPDPGPAARRHRSDQRSRSWFYIGQRRAGRGA